MTRSTVLALSLTLLAASGSRAPTPAQDSPGKAPKLLPGRAHASESRSVHGGSSSAAAAVHGFGLLGARYCTGGDDCPRCRGGLGGGQALGHGALRGATGAIREGARSGQPFIDPWARADWIAAHEAAQRSWHGEYYNTQWGTPVALMVPPTARTQTRWGWGVAQSTVTPIWHQFERPYPGAPGGAEAGGESGLSGAGGFKPTPRWPSHTDQFGTYYVRGPW